MSDSDYARVVEELKGSQAHRGDAAAQQLQRMTVITLTGLVGHYARMAGHPAAVAERAAGLVKRVEALSEWQVTSELQEVAYEHCTELKGAAASAFEFALRDIERQIHRAESLPR